MLYISHLFYDHIMILFLKSIYLDVAIHTFRHTFLISMLKTLGKSDIVLKL